MSKNYRLGCVKRAGSTLYMHRRVVLTRDINQIIAMDRKEHAVYKENALAVTYRHGLMEIRSHEYAIWLNTLWIASKQILISFY